MRKTEIMSRIYLRRRLGIQEHFVGYLSLQNAEVNSTEYWKFTPMPTTTLALNLALMIIYYDDNDDNNMMARQHASKRYES
jgi:hypothetical protein